jgi:hypothetical protein
MFDAYCPTCRTVRLYPLSHIRLVNSPLGIEVTVTCWCGTSFELLLGRGPRDLALAS